MLRYDIKEGETGSVNDSSVLAYCAAHGQLGQPRWQRSANTVMEQRAQVQGGALEVPALRWQLEAGRDENRGKIQREHMERAPPRTPPHKLRTG